MLENYKNKNVSSQQLSKRPKSFWILQKLSSRYLLGIENNDKNWKKVKEWHFRNGVSIHDLHFNAWASR